ncbi:homing endonuclease [Campylobacter phage NCTC12673]|uniref:Hef168 n=2 Tax=Fletchervirus NCTC12673 TaxID=934027 RepID=F4YAI8_9CAUD|nr:homing endonuclease [Campylobacter phage NCTC12673]YP_009321652.1 homing endonuclease [Campylobacter phage PC14]AEA86510.1 Hef168 [Campylobacter phage NCTC12673]ANH51346.1 putative homing endonuclease [Campylobacter phage PC14]
MTNHEKIIFLNNLGYKAISENLSKSLKVECKHGHIFGRMFDDFKRGSVNCPECDRLGKLNYLNNLGYKAVSENLADSLHVECPKGHIFKRAFGDFKNGKINCPKCDIRNKLDYLNNLGYEVVSENLSKGLEVRCSNGHVFKRAFGKFKDGFTTCPKCKDTNKVNYINNLGYEIISNNLADELKVRCIQGHIFNRTYGNFKQGKIICPTCNPSTSSFEKEVSNLLDNYIENDYSVLGDKELDFYLPKYNLAIECNGDYWHSESNGKGKDYHLDKTLKCESKGIHLLHIFEHSWYNKKEIWTSIINNKLGKSDKIMARKCILKEVPKVEEKEFLDNNHIQGFTGSSICYGLYFNNELVCLMSFGKPRFTDKCDWELIRLCTKMGVNVVGGASKLLKYFEKENEGSLISYSDRLYSDGKIYLKLGFTFSHYSKPGYYYFKNGTKYSRQQFMKHKLKDKLGKFDPNLTESENMKVNGYNRVWDCGQGVWVKGNLS